MLRTQIQLEEAQAEALRRRASERGVSISALIREAVASMLQGDRRDERVQRALSAAGAFSSGLSDVSAKHDEYLTDAYRA